MPLVPAACAAKAAVLATLIAVRAKRRRSLTDNGCLCAWAVGFLTGCCGASSTAVLLTFFFSSTHISKYGAKQKANIEKEYHASGNRSAWQVWSNGFAATAICTYLALCTGGVFVSKRLFLSFVAHYACCQGDTWSSEIGVLSSATPRLIVGFRQVPRGTNGGVTVVGLAAAAAGGALLGAVAAVTSINYPEGCGNATPLAIMLCSVGSAIAGSIIDSVLGQFLQMSLKTSSGHITDGKDNESPDKGATLISGRNLLSNNQVNLISSTIVAIGVFLLVDH